MQNHGFHGKYVYFVEVRVWDNHGETNCAQGIFETGLLSRKNWQAEWITDSLPQEEAACPVIIRSLTPAQKRIALARAYVTCCGVYELQINGEKAGDAFLAPGWTSYVYVYTEREVGRVVHPHFTYHGFRYIRLEGVDANADINCFTACVLHTDMERTGYFFCAHELISRLQSNIE